MPVHVVHLQLLLYPVVEQPVIAVQHNELLLTGVLPLVHVVHLQLLLYPLVEQPSILAQHFVPLLTGVVPLVHAVQAQLLLLYVEHPDTPSQQYPFLSG